MEEKEAWKVQSFKTATLRDQWENRHISRLASIELSVKSPRVCSGRNLCGLGISPVMPEAEIQGYPLTLLTGVWNIFFPLGIFELIPQDLIKIFDENELEVRNIVLIFKQDLCANFSCLWFDIFYFVASHVWIGRCRREWLERTHKVQKWLQCKSSSHPVVLEGNGKLPFSEIAFR